MTVLWESWRNVARRTARETIEVMRSHADCMFPLEVSEVATDMRVRIAEAMTKAGTCDDEIIEALNEFDLVFRPRAIALLETRPDWTAQ